MFFKKNIKILILTLSLTILPATINAMENNHDKITSNHQPITTKNGKILNDIEIEIREIENKNFEYLYIGEIDVDIFILEEKIKKLSELKEKTNNRVFKSATKELINKSSSLIVSLLEQNINALINKNLENIGECEIYNYLNSLKDYKKTLINVKKEIPELNTINKINELISIINNMLINLFEKYMITIEKSDIENYKDFTDFGFEKYIEFLKNVEQELTNLKKENSNNIINIILDNAKNNIPKLLLNLYEKYISKLKNKAFNNMILIEINQQKASLEQNKNTLNHLKEKINDLESQNKLNTLINEISSLIKKLEIIKDIKQPKNSEIKKFEINKKSE